MGACAALGSPDWSCPALGAQVLAGAIYNSHIDHDSGSDDAGSGDDSKCYGDDCFLLAHVAVVAVELLGCVAGAVLTLRTRVVYRTIMRWGSTGE